MNTLSELLHQHIHSSYLFIFIFLFIILFLLDSRFNIVDKIIRIAQRLSSSKTFLVLLFLSSFLILIFFANSVLLRFPYAGSEKAYIYQAETFLKGRLWNSPPPPDFFDNNRIINVHGKYLAKTFPGWSFILSIAIFLHIPTWLVNPIIGTISLIILFILAKFLYNNTIGLLSVIAVLGSPFFLFNSSTFIPNIPCGLFTLLTVYFFYRFTKKYAPIYVFLTGACLGAAYLIRPFSSLACIVPVLTGLILERKKDFFKKDIWFFLLGIVPFLTISFLYNYFTTGNCFLSPFNLADPHDTLHFKKSLILENIDIVETQLLWMNPALFISYFLMLISLSFKRKVQAPEFIFFILVSSCFFYFVPGSYGDRYYFEGYLFCILTVIGRLSQFKTGTPKRLIALALIAGFFMNLLDIPALAIHYRNKIYSRIELYRLVEKKNLSNAIVFVPSEGESISGIDLYNDPDLQNSVLYANDLNKKNPLLLKYFPSRDYYRYDPNEKTEDLRIQKIPQNLF